MKNDEFNKEKITNEKDGFSNFEYGDTPSSESASYLDNRNTFRDELNDTTVSNGEHTTEERKRRQDEDNKDQTKNEAQEFVEEQKILSKDIDDKK